MRLLVTGAAGFLGSHLCEYLLNKGHTVIGMDNLLTGSIENIKHLVTSPHFSFIEHDVRIPNFLPGKFDGVFHLASPASPIDYMKFPIETLQVSSIGTQNLLDFAKAKNARFLIASTSEVYGDPQIHPQNENYWGYVNPVGPRSCYDEAKRFGEAMTMAYHRTYDVDTRIVRIFNTYGPRMRATDGRVVSNFIVQALQGKPLTIYGSGNQTRSFCYVDDLIEGIYRLFNSNRVEPTNIGNPEEFTVLELAELIKDMTGTNVPLIMKPLPIDDPVRRKPDITVANTILSWEPKIKLRFGLEKTIEYFKNELSTT